MSTSAKIVCVEYDVLAERYTSLEIGSTTYGISDTIADQNIEIKRKPSKTLVEKIAADLASAMVGAKGGSVRLLDTNGDGEPDELYIADNPDPAKAKKVWRFNYEGWAASEKGYNGPFKMGATFTGGFQAWMVTAANLVTGTIDAKTVVISNMSADSITSGTLDAKTVAIANLSADSITSGTLDAERIDTDNLKVNAINITGTINGRNVEDLPFSNLSGRISSAQISADNDALNYLYGKEIYVERDGYVVFTTLADGPVTLSANGVENYYGQSATWGAIIAAANK